MGQHEVEVNDAFRDSARLNTRYKALCILGNHEVEAMGCYRATGKYSDPALKDSWLAKECQRREV